MVSSMKLNIIKDASPGAKVTRSNRAGQRNGHCLNLNNSGKVSKKFPAGLSRGTLLGGLFTHNTLISDALLREAVLVKVVLFGRLTFFQRPFARCRPCN
jgi:hypothetical protein